MINNLLYIVGPPGSGKSTLARELTSGWDRMVVRQPPVPHVLLRHPSSGFCAGLELGVPREQFPGTDTLAMDIAPRASVFLTRACLPFALGEGSRLATRPFLGGLVELGVRLTFVSLRASQELLEERWLARGARQNPSWRKGAATRAQRMEEWARSQRSMIRVELDSEQTLEQQAAAVREAFPLISLED